MKFTVKVDAILKHLGNVINGIEIETSWSSINKDKVKIVLYKISTHGWYFDEFERAELDINHCLTLIYRNANAQLDEYFSKYYNDQRLISIKTRLIKNYPQRKDIFDELFNTFSKKYYFSTITIALTQVDGICHDSLGDKFFMNNRSYQPKVYDKMREKGYLSYIDFLLSPIEQKTTVNSREHDLVNYPIRLNRHEIIHGVDINYGNKINALKMISLLAFIDYVVQYFDKIK